MKLRHPALIRLAAFLGANVIRLWMGTLHVRIDTRAAGQSHPVDPKKARYIYAFWHESILALTRAGGKAHALISRHADGELIAQIAEFLGYRAARGSTTRGGSEGLLQLLEASTHTHVAVTPDGPRGPRRRVQMGTIFLASRSGLPIVPVAIGYGKAWRASSWDRFAIPAPFSTIYAVLGEPMAVPAKLNRPALEQYRRRFEQRFLQVTEQADAWANSNKAQCPDIERVRVSA